MAKKLDELNSASGVIGAFLLSSKGKGKVVLNELPPEYKKIDFKSMIPFIVAFFESSKSNIGNINLADVLFEGGRLIIRKEGNMILGALCRSQANISLLRMTFNVVAASLKKERSIMKHFK